MKIFSKVNNFRAVKRAANTLAIGSVFLFTTNFSQAQSVKTLEDLKSLQAKIQAVALKVQPATVALTSTKSGSSGSGVVVNESGLILTAAHVVERNREMNVIFPDGKVYVGKVLGANRTKDVAMVQLIKQQKWPFAKIGDSAAMKVGDHVIAMGHAGGYDTRRKPPVRFGRLLSKNRNGFITTDCTLIGGDSGGPLFDLEGNVVGINSSIGDIWANNNHAGITALVADWDKLAKGETWGQLNQNPMADPDSPVMGFKFEELDDKQGVLIEEVLKKSPAKKAGLKAGDIVSAIDNEIIKQGRDLMVAMAHHQPGDVVTVTVLRKKQVLKLNMKLTRRGDFFKP